MKSDTERKFFHNEKIHQKKDRLHVHLSKDLRSKLRSKKRSLLVHKDDKVKILRGDHKGKEAKVSRVSVLRRKVFLEGIANKNAKGKELPIPMDPSNLLLVGIEPTKERRELFSENAFKAKEAKKEEKPAQKPEAKAEGKTEKAEAPHAKSETTNPQHAQVAHSHKAVPNDNTRM